MDSTNIKDSFQYAAEESKIDFQGDITSLLEASTVMRTKIDTAAKNGKSGIYFSLADSETFYQWIMKTAAGMLSHYNAIDRTNRKAMALFNAANKIDQQSRCTCKHLIAADKFLIEWENYKRTI